MLNGINMDIEYKLKINKKIILYLICHISKKINKPKKSAWRTTNNTVNLNIEVYKQRDITPKW